MATNTDGSLTLDLVLRSEGYRAGMDKVGRINDQKMRAMEARAEKAGKAIGKSLDSSALIASSVLDQALDMLGRTSRQVGQAKKPVQSARTRYWPSGRPGRRSWAKPGRAIANHSRICPSSTKHY
ncbi:hypothetical protein P4234_02060 [Pseudomonas aeruginosa]|nr:hypothetical protein [Pseudomonas aeruginosa]